MSGPGQGPLSSTPGADLPGARLHQRSAGATFSPSRVYRYALWREWDATLPTVVFCGLNPSTADETVDDPTVRRELGFARDWGFGRYVKVNAYGLRSTDPKGLWRVTDPRGPDNFLAIKVHCFEAMTKRTDGMFVAAWGNNIRERDAFELRNLLRFEGVKVHALRLTKQGNPQHPLYLPKDTKPFVWPASSALAVRGEGSQHDLPSRTAHEDAAILQPGQAPRPCAEVAPLGGGYGADTSEGEQ